MLSSQQLDSNLVASVPCLLGTKAVKRSINQFLFQIAEQFTISIIDTAAVNVVLLRPQYVMVFVIDLV